MSANNYTLIAGVGGRYYLWDNLNAEEAVKNQTLTLQNADCLFENLEQAVNYANENCDTEYGYQINNFRKPKDGFKEKFNFHD